MNCNQFEKAREFIVEEFDYYDKKSKKYKKCYISLMLIDIIVSALIPFVTLFMTNFTFTKYIVAFMGSVVTIVSGCLATFQVHELWVTYRITAEKLKHHKNLFELNVPPYDESDRSERLAINMYKIVDKENSSWTYIKNNSSNQSGE